jgi:hypothetical protein
MRGAGPRRPRAAVRNTDRRSFYGTPVQIRKCRIFGRLVKTPQEEMSMFVNILAERAARLPVRHNERQAGTGLALWL